MTLALFYVDRTDLQSVAVGGAIELAGDEGNHAVRVKRVRVGEHLLIGDGAGRQVRAEVSEILGKTGLRAHALEVFDHVLPKPQIRVIQGLIKGERMDRALETLTESGIDRIGLWPAARSIAKLDSTRGLGKFEAKVIQASKQARRAFVPALEAVTDIQEMVRQAHGPVLVLDEEAQAPLSQVLPASSVAVAEELTIIVGPEGGIDPAEREQFRAAGAQLVSMGSVIARASTAGTVAAGWVMGATGRWGVQHLSDE